MKKSNNTKSLQGYAEAKFSSTKCYLDNSRFYPELDNGIRWLARARMGAYWMAPKAAAARLVPMVYGYTCPSCNFNEVEDWKHVLLRCPLGRNARAQHIEPVLKEMNQSLPVGLSDEDRSVIILGGDVRGVTLGDQWSGGAKPGQNESIPHFVQVAQYLDKVVHLRMSRLWQHYLSQ